MAVTVASEPDITRSQRDQAARWLVRLDGGSIDEAERRSLTAWLAADPRHAAALREAEALWDRLEAPARRLAAERATAPQPRPSRRGRPWIWAGAGLATPALALLLWCAAPDLGRLAGNLGADVVTAQGERRSLDLPDGSSLELAPDTAVALGFDAGRREVHLLRGQAFFTVRRGLETSFTVLAGQGRVRVLGTRFDVERAGDRVDVTVENGLVEVSGRLGVTPVRLRGGQRVTVEGGRLTRPGPAALDAAFAWRSGSLVFYREPLPRVVARLERQRSGRILVARESLRGLTVSGAFPGEDSDGALRAIADTLDARLVTVTPWLTILY
nr:FecR domain-containing protein [Plastoroseomonas hellenica]